jgi:hypothetical protein
VADVYEPTIVCARAHVPINVLAPAFDRDRGFVEWFRRRARAAAHLN